MRRRPIIPLAVLAAAALSLFGAGCGGGSTGVASVASSTAAAPTSTPAATTTVQYGANGTQAGALAFARCMRAHGIPNWPDPESNGTFDKHKLQELGVGRSRVRSIEQTYCHYSFQNAGQSPRYTITPTDRADYLEAAACIRAHGFPDFPDPTFRNNAVTTNIPSTIAQDSPRFKSAAAACTKLIPAGLPYSHSQGS